MSDDEGPAPREEPLPEEQPSEEDAPEGQDPNVDVALNEVEDDPNTYPDPDNPMRSGPF